MLSLSSAVLKQGVTTFGRHLRASTALIVPSRREYQKRYDEQILLEPENIEYRYGDSRFLPGPKFHDEPFIKPTDEEIVELTRIKLENEISRDVITKVDPNQAPYNEVLEGVDDGDKFTKVERIPDLEARWPWVERLLEKQLLTKPIRPGSQLLPQIPELPPNLPYFVQRTRSRVFPIYRTYEIVGRDHKRYWRNRWDGLFNKYHTGILDNLHEVKWENNEKTITLTEVNRVRGDIWAFEQDARTYLEENMIDLPEGHRILTAVNELRGRVQFKGDHVQLLYKFLVQQGF